MTAKTQFKQWDFYVCLALGLAAFIFVLYRIFNVSLIWDEWGMWKYSIKPGLEALITFQHKDPQSHFLQGLFAIPFTKLPIYGVTAIRLPSLLMFPIYIGSGLYLAQKFKYSLYRLFFFCTWLCPQVIIEYFGMARGYPYMIAFTGLSLVGLIEAWSPSNTDVQKTNWTKVSIISAALAMLAILTFSYAYLMIAFLLLFRYYVENKGTFWQKVSKSIKSGNFVIWTTIALVIFFLPRYLILKDCPTMQWGGTSNFISDTFSTFISNVTYLKYQDNWSRELNHNTIYGIPIFVFCMVNAVALFYGVYKRQIKLQSPAVLMSIILIGVGIVSQILFWLFGMQFPTHRTVLYLWPVFVILLGFFAYDKNNNLLLRFLNIVLMCAFIVRAAFTYNTYNVHESRADIENREVAKYFYDLVKNRPDKSRPLFVGMTDCTRYTIWYYLEYELGMKVHPNFQNNPIFKLFGDNELFMYSLNYGYPQPFPQMWHHFPFQPDYYYLSHFERGNEVDSKLMYTMPVHKFEKCEANLFKSKIPPEGNLGCNVNYCPICQALYSMTDAGKEGENNDK